ncbi:hypothetical protein C9374_006209 [Naegleria lovaniensis]|uniref:Uncharacterized protein n=1 Tax=Naegleria lovaniensis TaxID=51637 RepID=A0AA88GPR7_NAELO|nr:uncharacterized protein C9374_006209 [Naegleria lovaniensis]KAG2381825.1 hypothetical protein C9374_006209 [Naegleria lovaniensis]
MKHRNNTNNLNPTITSGGSIGISSSGSRKSFKVNVPKPVNLPISSSTAVNTNITSGSSFNGTPNTVSTGSAASSGMSNALSMSSNVSNTSNTTSNAWASKPFPLLQSNTSESSQQYTDPSIPHQIETKVVNTPLSLPVRSTRTPVISSPARNDDNDDDDDEIITSNHKGSSTTTTSATTPSDSEHRSDKKSTPQMLPGDSNWSEISDDDEIYDKELEELIEKENKSSTPPVKSKKQKYLEKKKLLREQERLNAEKQTTSVTSTPKSDSESSIKATITSPSVHNVSPPPSPPSFSTEPQHQKFFSQSPPQQNNPPPSSIPLSQSFPPMASTAVTPSETTPVEANTHKPNTVPSFFSTTRPSNTTQPSRNSHPTGGSTSHTVSHQPQASPRKDIPKEEIIKSILEQEVIMNEAAERRRKEKMEEEERLERERKEKAQAKLLELERKLQAKKVLQQPAETESQNPTVTSNANETQPQPLSPQPHHQQYGEVKILKSNRANQQHGRGGSSLRQQRNTTDTSSSTNQNSSGTQEKQPPTNPTELDNNWRDSTIKVPNAFVESFQKSKKSEIEHTVPPRDKHHEGEVTRHPNVGRGSYGNREANRGGNTRGRGNYHNVNGQQPRNNRNKQNVVNVTSQNETQNENVEKSNQFATLDLSNVLKNNINPNEAKISFGLFADDSKPATTLSHGNAIQQQSAPLSHQNENHQGDLTPSQVNVENTLQDNSNGKPFKQRRERPYSQSGGHKPSHSHHHHSHSGYSNRRNSEDTSSISFKKVQDSNTLTDNQNNKDTQQSHSNGEAHHLPSTAISNMAQESTSQPSPNVNHSDSRPSSSRNPRDYSKRGQNTHHSNNPHHHPTSRNYNNQTNNGQHNYEKPHSNRPRDSNSRDQIKHLLSQHYKELQVFGSSCKAYRRFLSRFKGCPFQLYTHHIDLRWNETMKTWKHKLKEHESYGFVLNESLSFLRSIPDHPFLGHLLDLKKFISSMQEKFRLALDCAFRKYRILHEWIANFQSNVKTLTKKHDDKHHSRVDFKQHECCNVVPYSIGQRTRIRKECFDQIKASEYLIQLKNQIDEDIRRFVARFGGNNTIGEHPPLPLKMNFKECKLEDDSHLNRIDNSYDRKEHRKSCVRVQPERTSISDKRVHIKQQALESKRSSNFTTEHNHECPPAHVRRCEFHEMPDRQLEKDLHDTMPYVLFSIPASSVNTDDRFRSHNANMTKRKRLEKLGKFDFSDVISMQQYKNLVQDVQDGDDVLNGTKIPARKKIPSQHAGQRSSKS